MLKTCEASKAVGRLEMKNQTTKRTTPAKVTGAHAGSGGVEGKGLVLRCERYSHDPDEWPRPTELELAKLAAQLARTEKIDPKELVNEAWSIYLESCQKVMEDHLDAEGKRAAMEASDADVPDEASELGQPKRFPITFQELELLLLPKRKGRTAERAALFREYIFAELVNQSFFYDDSGDNSTYWDYQPHDLDQWRAEAGDEVAEEYGRWRKRTYDAKAYASIRASFLRWYRTWTHMKNSEVKAANALKGWEKRRKAKTAKTGAKPKMGELRQILEGPPKGPPPGC